MCPGGKSSCILETTLSAPSNLLENNASLLGHENLEVATGCCWDSLVLSSICDLQLLQVTPFHMEKQ